MDIAKYRKLQANYFTMITFLRNRSEMYLTFLVFSRIFEFIDKAFHSNNFVLNVCIFRKHRKAENNVKSFLDDSNRYFHEFCIPPFLASLYGTLYNCILACNALK